MVRAVYIEKMDKFNQVFGEIISLFRGNFIGYFRIETSWT